MIPGEVIEVGAAMPSALWKERSCVWWAWPSVQRLSFFC